MQFPKLLASVSINCEATRNVIRAIFSILGLRSRVNVHLWINLLNGITWKAFGKIKKYYLKIVQMQLILVILLFVFFIPLNPFFNSFLIKKKSISLVTQMFKTWLHSLGLNKVQLLYFKRTNFQAFQYNFSSFQCFELFSVKTKNSTALPTQLLCSISHLLIQQIVSVIPDSIRVLLCT